MKEIRLDRALNWLRFAISDVGAPNQTGAAPRWY